MVEWAGCREYVLKTRKSALMENRETPANSALTATRRALLARNLPACSGFAASQRSDRRLQARRPLRRASARRRRETPAAADFLAAIPERPAARQGDRPPPGDDESRRRGARRLACRQAVRS